MINEQDIQTAKERVYDSANAFSNSLTEILAYIETDLETAFRKACINLFTRIQERTPIDTGRAKANWSLGLSVKNQSKISTEHKEEKTKEIKAFETEWGRFRKRNSGFNFTLKDGYVYIYNNLEYITALEAGHSQAQAPSGMVAVSLEEFEQHFRRALRTARGIE